MNIPILSAGAIALLLATNLPAAEMRVIHSGVVNDRIPNAQCPIGLARDADGNYVTVFVNHGDGVAGCTNYFSRTTDLGKSWSEPFLEYAPKAAEVGTGLAFTQLTDGRILGTLMEITHADTSLEGFKGYRTGTAKIVEIDLTNRAIVPVATLAAPATSLPAPMGNNIVTLTDGELLLPCYVYAQAAPEPDFPYGSGFYRSRDGGKSWGPFERIFREPDPQHPLGFSESVIFEKPDGTLVAFTRIDSRPVNNMWKAVSHDRGATWSDPEETDIPAVYPVGVKTRSGDYLMTAGYLKAATPRTTTVFFSTDGEHFTPIGEPYYSRPGNGRPHNTATGGSQAIIETEPGKFLLTFYGSDPVLPGRDSCYVDSNYFELIQ